MKIGFRRPSVKRMVKARTVGRAKRAVKRSVNPLHGKKGMGLAHPKRAARNYVYRRTTFGLGDVLRWIRK